MFRPYINLGHHQVPRLFLFILLALQSQYCFCFLAGILFCANTQCGTAIRILCTLVKVLSFFSILSTFCCSKMSSWIFVSRVGTLSVALQPAYWVKLIKSNLKYLTELHI